MNLTKKLEKVWTHYVSDLKFRKIYLTKFIQNASNSFKNVIIKNLKSKSIKQEKTAAFANKKIQFPWAQAFVIQDIFSQFLANPFNPLQKKTIHSPYKLLIWVTKINLVEKKGSVCWFKLTISPCLCLVCIYMC